MVRWKKKKKLNEMMKKNLNENSSLDDENSYLKFNFTDNSAINQCKQTIKLSWLIKKFLKENVAFLTQN